jgi:CRISPR-associated protein Csd1
MILPALNKYYHRQKTEGLVDIANEGFQKQPIPIIVVLDRGGRFLSLVDTRSGEGKNKSTRTFTVPRAIKRASGVAANLLWDVPAYVFGQPKPDPKKNPADNRQRTQEQQHQFIETIRNRLAAILEDDGISAVMCFLSHRDYNDVFNHPAWKEIEVKGLNVSFQLEGDTCLVCERPEVVNAIARDIAKGSGTLQACLVSGAMDSPVRLHTSIKRVFGAQTSGANIVSFNLPAFTSYGKKQSYNAPVGKASEFGYTTALNHLLAQGSKQRLQVGDTSTVFWAETRHEIENVFSGLFGEPPKGEPAQDYKQLIAMFRSADTGAPPQMDPTIPFYVLGLAPNSARIAIRYWYAGSVREIANNIWQHFDDLEMAKSAMEWRHLAMSSLLRATALQEKIENIPSNLAGDTMKAALTGSPYPQTLLSAAIRRCRAEQQVNYHRAALIKAVLVRDQRFGIRFGRNNEKELRMSLDPANQNIGYRLGRLFATLEKIQEESSPGINTTIRDRFYGAASASPIAAFPQLIKLKNHHLSKLENRGRAVNLEKMITTIFDGINDFPTHLSLPDQGRFAIGYYHQRQDFFTKQDKN